jgi:hypothetical protein
MRQPRLNGAAAVSDARSARIHATRARRRSSPAPSSRSSFRARERASPSSGVRRSPRTTRSRLDRCRTRACFPRRERACSPNAWVNLRARPGALNAQSLHQTLQAWRTPKRPAHARRGKSTDVRARGLVGAHCEEPGFASNAITATARARPRPRPRLRALRPRPRRSPRGLRDFQAGRLVCGLSAGRRVGDRCHRRW